MALKSSRAHSLWNARQKYNNILKALYRKKVDIYIRHLRRNLSKLHWRRDEKTSIKGNFTFGSTMHTWLPIFRSFLQVLLLLKEFGRYFILKSAALAQETPSWHLLLTKVHLKFFSVYLTSKLPSIWDNGSWNVLFLTSKHSLKNLLSLEKNTREHKNEFIALINDFKVIFLLTRTVK